MGNITSSASNDIVCQEYRLWDAAYAGNVDEVVQLVADGVNVNARR